ncbi:hypothetical protein ABZT17_36960 [Streptomyces sp. NPDC005648]|uniref:hypothetical protein n=1 Tax=Streptomyces sp. NPDC005648 TaxID=3157044 RepID=UPI00339F7D04
MALVSAYAFYVQERSFALRGGADGVSAALWPLSVDGLLLLATVGLLKPSRHASSGVGRGTLGVVDRIPLRVVQVQPSATHQVSRRVWPRSCRTRAGRQWCHRA